MTKNNFSSDLDQFLATNWDQVNDNIQDNISNYRYEEKDFSNYEYSDDDLVSLRLARNENLGFNYRATLNPQSNVLESSGILMNGDEAVYDLKGDLIVEVPPVSSNDDSFELVLDSQLEHISRFDSEQSQESSFKLLIPCANGGHWTFRDITVFRNTNDKLTVSAISHDPLGEGKIDQKMKDSIKRVFESRYGADNLDFDLDAISNDPKVQLSVVGCGVYIAEAEFALKRAAKISAPNFDVWNQYENGNAKSEAKMRKDHYSLVKNIYDKDVDKGLEIDKSLMPTDAIRDSYVASNNPSKSKSSPKSSFNFNKKLSLLGVAALAASRFNVVGANSNLRMQDENNRGIKLQGPTVYPPTFKPTARPSQPTSWPTLQPASNPSFQPTTTPSGQPSSYPSAEPSAEPSVQPSGQPSSYPSAEPSVQPSGQPLSFPSAEPSVQPSGKPSSYPSAAQSAQPSVQPSSFPSAEPSGQPSVQPTFQPTVQPSSAPSVEPTSQPSSVDLTSSASLNSRVRNTVGKSNNTIAISDTIASLIVIPAAETMAVSSASAITKVVTGSYVATSVIASLATSPLLTKVFEYVRESSNPVITKSVSRRLAITEVSESNDFFEGYYQTCQSIENNNIDDDIGNLDDLFIAGKISLRERKAIKSIYEEGDNSLSKGLEITNKTCSSSLEPIPHAQKEYFLIDQIKEIESLTNLGEGHYILGMEKVLKFFGEREDKLENFNINDPDLDPKLRDFLIGCSNLGEELGIIDLNDQILAGMEDIFCAINEVQTNEAQRPQGRRLSSEEESQHQGQILSRQLRTRQERFEENKKGEKLGWAFLAVIATACIINSISSYPARKLQARTAENNTDILAAYMEETLPEINKYYAIADDIVIADAIFKILENKTLFQGKILPKNEEGHISVSLDSLKSSLEDNYQYHSAINILNSYFEKKVEKRNIEKSEFTGLKRFGKDKSSSKHKSLKQEIEELTSQINLVANAVDLKYNDNVLRENVVKESIDKMHADRKVEVENVWKVMKEELDENKQIHTKLTGLFSDEFMSPPQGESTTQYYAHLATRYIPLIMEGAVNIGRKIYPTEDELSPIVENFRKVADQKTSWRETTRKITTGYNPEEIIFDFRSSTGQRNTLILGAFLEQAVKDIAKEVEKKLPDREVEKGRRNIVGGHKVYNYEPDKDAESSDNEQFNREDNTISLGQIVINLDSTDGRSSQVEEVVNNESDKESGDSTDTLLLRRKLETFLSVNRDRVILQNAQIERPIEEEKDDGEEIEEEKDDNRHIGPAMTATVYKPAELKSSQEAKDENKSGLVVHDEGAEQIRKLIGDQNKFDLSNPEQQVVSTLFSGVDIAALSSSRDVSQFMRRVSDDQIPISDLLNKVSEVMGLTDIFRVLLESVVQKVDNERVVSKCLVMLLTDNAHKTQKKPNAVTDLASQGNDANKSCFNIVDIFGEELIPEGSSPQRVEVIPSSLTPTENETGSDAKHSERRLSNSSGLKINPLAYRRRPSKTQPSTSTSTSTQSVTPAAAAGGPDHKL